MNTALTIAMILTAFAVFGTLGLGIFSMVKGGEFNKKHGNKLMQARVALQGLALAMVALLFLISQS